MRVCVSVKGRFHAFHLAAQLQRHGALQQLITSYPGVIASRFGVERSKVTSIVSTEFLSRALQRLPADVFDAWALEGRLHEHFERRARRAMGAGADLFVGWSGVSLGPIEHARTLGMRTIVERGSSHIVEQTELLEQECEDVGVAAPLPHPRVIEQELQEYDAADFISIPSTFVRESFLRQGIPDSKLIQIPYGVCLDEFQASPPPETPFRILHCGTVSVRKGCPRLLQAFRNLKLKNAELRFVGAVEPGLRSRWKRLPKGVSWSPPVPQSQLSKEYAQASMFCLASIEEGLAMVIPQAMACGKPIVATNHTGARDILQHGEHGLLVKAGDTESLEEAILWMYEHQEEAAAMGRAARQRVERGLTWDRYGDRIVRAYRKVLLEDSLPSALVDDEEEAGALPEFV